MLLNFSDYKFKELESHAVRMRGHLTFKDGKNQENTYRTLMGYICLPQINNLAKLLLS
jgi:hypothetical protein